MAKFLTSPSPSVGRAITAACTVAVVVWGKRATFDRVGRIGSIRHEGEDLHRTVEVYFLTSPITSPK